MAREPITFIEVDDEVCTRTFGVGGCTATLGGEVVRKCYGTFATCPVKSLFDPVTRTLRYGEPRYLTPGSSVMFPALESVSEISGTVNIAGSDTSMSAFGRRATVSVDLNEFQHHDRGIDPYAAERVTGAAQIDEPGYDPATRGGHFAKQKARNPYYPGRALRMVTAYLVDGVITDPVSRHYVQTERSTSDDGKAVRIEAADVLDLAGNDKATALDVNKGALLANITIDATTATLSPAGVGDADYEASGRATIGSEIVSFTRSGDVLTFTARGLAGSTQATHSAGDTVQEIVHVDKWRVDDTLKFLLNTRAKVPLAFLPLADWKDEIDRWMPQVRLDTHLCKPDEGVALLVGELAVLGVSIWWDDVAQLVRLKVSRPPDLDDVHQINDDAHILAIASEDRQADRLTEIMFFTVQIDPTKSATSSDNYRRVTVPVATAAKLPAAYGDTKVRKIYCRWLNQGANSVVLYLAQRILQRFAAAQVRTTITLDAKDRGLELVDVLVVSSIKGQQDATGKARAAQMQVIRKTGDRDGILEIAAQAFFFEGRYAYATENTRPTYTASSAAQKARGMYACDPATLKMSNGDEPYKAI